MVTSFCSGTGMHFDRVTVPSFGKREPLSCIVPSPPCCRTTSCPSVLPPSSFALAKPARLPGPSPVSSSGPVLNAHILFCPIPRPIEETKQGLSAKRTAREGRKSKRTERKTNGPTLADVSACAPTVQSTGHKSRSTPPSLVHTPARSRSQPRRQGQTERRKGEKDLKDEEGGEKTHMGWVSGRLFCQVLQHGTPERETLDTRW
jgi:hypothetical protein